MSYFTDLLIKRRSVRKFTDEPLTPEENTANTSSRIIIADFEK
jgi:hypothetical protein